MPKEANKKQDSKKQSKDKKQGSGNWNHPSSSAANLLPGKTVGQNFPIRKKRLFYYQRWFSHFVNDWD